MSPASRVSSRMPLIAVSLLVLAACAADDATSPSVDLAARPFDANAVVAEVRRLTASRGISALPAPPRVRRELVQLGRLLAFDKELSGNRDIACMTCHLPRLATGDGRSLSIGQGGTALGEMRTHPTATFIPRNAPAAFNLHALESFFWDGRVFVDGAGTVHSPAGEKITPAMASVVEFGGLSALPLFPVLSRSELRGDTGNELAALSDEQEPAIWAALMRRLGRIPEYRAHFRAAYPGTEFDAMTFAHASNAIAGFLIAEFASDGSPWDRFLAGDDAALTETQLAGAKNFMSARCSICHNGPAFTDNQFHNVAVAQIGPGQGDGLGGRDDFGRMRVTGAGSDRYRFRTTPLRNVELTGPWGHDGAFTDLRAFVDHYSESDLKLQHYDVGQLEPLLRGSLVANLIDILVTRDTLLDGVVFTPQQVDEVTEFMKALTDPAVRNLARRAPQRVPSGLPVDDNRKDPLAVPGGR